MIDRRNGGSWPDIQELVGDADGVIFLENPHFTMRIFNRDGSEAQMCGNGLCCFIQFLIDLGISQKRYTVHTKAGDLEGWPVEDMIEITLPKPSELTQIYVDGHTFSFINTGVPHAICFEPIEDVLFFGQKFVKHPAFGPEGTNVNVCAIRDGKLHVRTFERGVNKETGACGTGAVACALASKLPSPIYVIPSSQETITVNLSPLTLQSKVAIVAPL